MNFKREKDCLQTIDERTTPKLVKEVKKS